MDLGGHLPGDHHFLEGLVIHLDIVHTVDGGPRPLDHGKGLVLLPLLAENVYFQGFFFIG